MSSKTEESWEIKKIFLVSVVSFLKPQNLSGNNSPFLTGQSWEVHSEVVWLIGFAKWFQWWQQVWHKQQINLKDSGKCAKPNLLVTTHCFHVKSNFPFSSEWSVLLGLKRYNLVVLVTHQMQDLLGVHCASFSGNYQQKKQKAWLKSDHIKIHPKICFSSMTTVPIFEANAKQDESLDGCLASPTTCVGRRVSNLALGSGKTRRKWLGTVKNYFQ